MNGSSGKYALKDLEANGDTTSTATSTYPPSYSDAVSDGKFATSTDALAAEEESERGHWGNKAEFILSCLGYAVGLGNVWRFPYLCYTNGGGAFLIPYFLMLTFVGLPVFLLELSSGQFVGGGPLDVFMCSPLLQGVGVGMLIISFLGSIYYNVIIAWAMYYMFGSFTSELPWDGCKHDYNTPYCYSKKEAKPCEDSNGTWFNQTCYSPEMLIENPEIKNLTLKNTTAPEEFFNIRMLNRSDSIEDMGSLSWELSLTLLLAWILVYLCILKGIKSSGKAVYFTATFPYVILIIFFFRGVTLEGAGKGIEFYLKPKWELLLVPKVWGDAAGQIFFSLSVGMGGLMTFSSYNKFNNNVFRDALIVALGNCFTSFFAGFAIFSILGFMAHELGKDVSEVATSGSGLAFIAYPEVVTRLPVAPLWSFLFFFMLLLLGLDSQFAGIEAIQTAVLDVWPRLRRVKPLVAGVICVVLFLLGLPMCAQGGIYWEELVSYYSAGWSLVLIGFVETLVFAWVYGAKRMMNDMEQMIGFRPSCNGWYWWVLWTIVAPILLFAILIFNFIEFTPLEYGGYVLPPWAQGLGWIMAVISVAIVPVVAAYRIWKDYKTNEDGASFMERVVRLTKPDPIVWRPSIVKAQEEMSSKQGNMNAGFHSSQDTIGGVSHISNTAI
ncbi:sodium- and chloride-dependent GABA transporter 1 isoform X2 [Lingula anatina]|uniref:Transporter n=1 Tax=Lingula anatina TaxID=7574 RepID=A0A1S3JWF3_LINAN|nr:sodium- and chloride-dependent GABA transporter 1 isoform X1 [Lingula anatina]XP_013414370.1 sodium- and chloride-dependent GABA transporter 1 isoform X2 [Lingula anatina]|eukprot:XP_013414369.1 sodium- and chloride-dependent GABA transporter 1 isoform X1 [Lingula anatina]